MCGQSSLSTELISMLNATWHLWQIVWMIFIRMIREFNDFSRWSVDFSSRYPVDLLLSCLFFFQPIWLCRFVLHYSLNITVPFPIRSFHSSHPTLCTGSGWSYCPCHATHVITLFFSYHPSLASCQVTPSPTPPFLCITCFKYMAELFIIWAICISIKCVVNSQFHCQLLCLS